LQTNVTTTLDRSLFPDIQLPDAIGSRATKFHEMAHEGDEWRSPIFDIGSTSPSSNIPAPKVISKKSPPQYNRPSIKEGRGASPKGVQSSEEAETQQISGGYGYNPSGSQATRVRSNADSLRTAVEDETDFAKHEASTPTMRAQNAARQVY
jgi:Protein of unknown function (DUF4449)